MKQATIQSKMCRQVLFGRGRWFFVVLMLALFIWKLIAELIEPHFLLWLRPRLPYDEVQLANGMSLRLYQDTRPYVGKIAGLQKGLIWVQDRQVLVEEAYGFGCPIIHYNGMAYNSVHAEIEKSVMGDSTRLTKHFEIDTADTPIQFLRRKYRPVPSLGIVTIHYDIDLNATIDVTVDLSALTVAWDKAYLMSEQGAHHFTRYQDSNGTQRDAAQLGIWQTADPLPVSACFESQKRILRFCVEPQPPARLYYGRERYNQYNWRGIYTLAWSGADIEIDPTPIYRYRIFLEAQ